MSGDVVATLTCPQCGEDGRHELTYVGRILARTRCLNCGFTTEHEPHDLRSAYLQDLEQRVVTKPGRMLRRLARHPLGYALGLPRAIVGKPMKLYQEIRPLLRRGGM